MASSRMESDLTGVSGPELLERLVELRDVVAQDAEKITANEAIIASNGAAIQSALKQLREIRGSLLQSSQLTQSQFYDYVKSYVINIRSEIGNKNNKITK